MLGWLVVLEKICYNDKKRVWSVKGDFSMTDLIIIGGGPAGLAAAVAARDAGVTDLLLLERETVLGGVLNQCIHTGFGLQTFGRDLTGPEFAHLLIREAERRGIPCKTGTAVLELDSDRTVTCLSREEGRQVMRTKAVILATGCRERPLGSLWIPGTRPSGIYTAGEAQRMVNVEGFLPGKRCVILGSGNVGLIMARRMTLEGAKVEAVVERSSCCGGSVRNRVLCLEDLGIPLLTEHTVARVHGCPRLEGVTVARLLDGSQRFIPCDTLLLSCGLVPEDTLFRGAGLTFEEQDLQCSIPGVFAAGNVRRIHELVDDVCREAARAGRRAAAYLLGGGTQ